MSVLSRFDNTLFSPSTCETMRTSICSPEFAALARQRTDPGLRHRLDFEEVYNLLTAELKCCTDSTLAAALFSGHTSFELFLLLRRATTFSSSSPKASANTSYDNFGQRKSSSKNTYLNKSNTENATSNFAEMHKSHVIDSSRELPWFALERLLNSKPGHYPGLDVLLEKISGEWIVDIDSNNIFSTTTKQHFQSLRNDNRELKNTCGTIESDEGDIHEGIPFRSGILNNMDATLLRSAEVLEFLVQDVALPSSVGSPSKDNLVGLWLPQTASELGQQPPIASNEQDEFSLLIAHVAHLFDTLLIDFASDDKDCQSFAGCTEDVLLLYLLQAHLLHVQKTSGFRPHGDLCLATKVGLSSGASVPPTGDPWQPQSSHRLDPSKQTKNFPQKSRRFAQILYEDIVVRRTILTDILPLAPRLILFYVCIGCDDYLLSPDYFEEDEILPDLLAGSALPFHKISIWEFVFRKTLDSIVCPVESVSNSHPHASSLHGQPTQVGLEENMSIEDAHMAQASSSSDFSSSSASGRVFPKERGDHNAQSGFVPQHMLFENMNLAREKITAHHSKLHTAKFHDTTLFLLRSLCVALVYALLRFLLFLEDKRQRLCLSEDREVPQKVPPFLTMDSQKESFQEGLKKNGSTIIEAAEADPIGEYERKYYEFYSSEETRALVKADACQKVLSQHKPNIDSVGALPHSVVAKNPLGMEVVVGNVLASENNEASLTRESENNEAVDANGSMHEAQTIFFEETASSREKFDTIEKEEKLYVECILDSLREVLRRGDAYGIQDAVREVGRLFIDDLHSPAVRMRGQQYLWEIGVDIDKCAC